MDDVGGNMAAVNAPQVRQSQLQVPSGPGLSLDLNMEFLRKNLAPARSSAGRSVSAEIKSTT